MAKISLDFIYCHWCDKRFGFDDPLANVHWKDCQHSPAREVVEDLLVALKCIAAWDFDIRGDCVAEAQAQARDAIAKAGQDT